MYAIRRYYGSREVMALSCGNSSDVVVETQQHEAAQNHPAAQGQGVEHAVAGGTPGEHLVEIKEYVSAVQSRNGSYNFV